MTALAVESGGGRTGPLTAVVHGVDGVRFVATAATGMQLAARVADYIRARCDDVLWPGAAREVRALIDDGKTFAAIALYFAHVGDRWDEERLELDGVSFDMNGACGSRHARPSVR